jgi:signal transduction histidine kinase
LTLIRSFRLRLLLGSALGALGLLAISHFVSIFFFRHYRVQLRLGSTAIVLTVALVFIAIGFVQVRRGLSPFDELRRRLAGVRDGRSRRLEGTYPTEVAPLVTDLNALLEHREGIVARALAKAGDLAHGLKTPLAVLAQEAEHAEAAGQHELAAAIAEQVERMRRQMDYHLAQARAAASGAAPGTHCSIRESMEALARTLQRLHAERGLAIVVDAPADLSVRCEREDVDEMLGNLLDNGCRFATSRVAVAAARKGDWILITVDDDGPGLPSELRDRVLQRGVRADEAGTGSGFGLAIVRDLAELYGGSISLDDSPKGGLQARLKLPAA